MNSQYKVTNSKPKYFTEHYPKHVSDLWPKTINGILSKVKDSRKNGYQKNKNQTRHSETLAFFPQRQIV